jgi:hypothetical protein
MGFLKKIDVALKEQKNYFLFVAIAFVLFGLMLITETSRGKFESNDFRVMYSAAEHFWHHKQIYNVPFGLDTGYYKYSPVVLLFFLPALIFSFFTASIIHFIFTYLVLISLFKVLFKFFEENYAITLSKTSLLFILLLGSITGHLIREFHLGNINLFLLLFSIFAFLLTTKEKPFLAGLLFAIVILTKPYLLVFVFPIVAFGYYRVFWSTFIWAILLILLSFSFIGYTSSIQLYSEWFLAMLAHSEYLISNNTIFHILEMTLNKKISAQLGIPLYILVASILFFYFQHQKKREVHANTKLLFLYAFTLLALFPNFLVTDTEHFLFSLPMLFFLVIQLFEKRKLGFWILYVVLILFYLGETNLVWGKEMATQIKQYGGMGIANLILVAWSFVLNLSAIKKENN